ncbi:hypothetical protein BDM02DRAFT_1704532 [Thelephora ganbajun]|uniref:Uncharacterized protein n=1 Tax=Thelephora ganbajun TaxID=370292 RepID=A0ACB6ZJG4_THEGA|nr:hypothetical protein BDM02DRAFT_1704532 [Thelephora ganbajun]
MSARPAPAPWNRPSLPTVNLLPSATRYVDIRNTDVTYPRLSPVRCCIDGIRSRNRRPEDSYIAVAPPPAYGNTRVGT